MPVYAGASFLCSCYPPDSNSGIAFATLQSLNGPMHFTALHRLELRNAFALAVFRARITSVQATAAWQDVVADLSGGRLAPARVNWYAVMRQSAMLSVQHAPTAGSRSLDVLHVAAALQTGVQEFFGFDSRQRTLAQLVGLIVRP